MSVFCVGINHRTAPVELRERFAMGEGDLPAALARLRAAGCADEAVWLSTCNRVELYVSSDSTRAELVRRFLMEASRIDGDPLGDALYLLREPESLEHLFRVASGLDSMVLGETEILGQIKRAYELARKHGHTGSRLNRAFQRAFNVAKQLRSETHIQRGGISVASVAVELAEHVFESVEGRSVLVIGAGETGEKVARALLSRGVAEVCIWNRSSERASALTQALGPRASQTTDWFETAARADVLISSTSAMGFVLDGPNVGRLMTLRERRPLLLIDLAVPRDIDPAANTLPGVYLFNVDDLQAIAEAHLRRRQAEVDRCEGLIRQKVGLLLSSGSRPPPMADSLSAQCEVQ
jgi:glutamyl-tRNA reductase